MIVELAKEVRDLTADIQKLDIDQNNLNNVRDTSVKLEELRLPALKLADFYALFADRLDTDGVSQRFSRIAAELKTSQQNFSEFPRQTTAISSIRNTVVELSGDLEKRWRDYATRTFQAGFDMLQLVRSLPELQTQIGSVERTQVQLRRYVETPPKNPAELADFDQKLKEMHDWLAGLEGSGLTEEVRYFLNKVLQGTATLLDLNSEVLQWCKQGKRMGNFQIRLAQPQNRPPTQPYNPNYRR